MPWLLLVVLFTRTRTHIHTHQTGQNARFAHVADVHNCCAEPFRLCCSPTPPSHHPHTPRRAMRAAGVPQNRVVELAVRKVLNGRQLHGVYDPARHCLRPGRADAHGRQASGQVQRRRLRDVERAGRQRPVALPAGPDHEVRAPQAHQRLPQRCVRAAAATAPGPSGALQPGGRWRAGRRGGQKGALEAGGRCGEKN